MSSPPTKIIKSRAGDESSAVSRMSKSQGNEAHKSEDIYPGSWRIPPGGDGFEIYVAESGNLVLKQAPICADEQTVVLNFVEAQALLRILPSAVALARRRKAAP
jgi:hypothetical protein